MKRFLLWLLPARRVHVPKTHPGIRLQISIPAGPLVDADSDHLYYAAKFGGYDEECRYSCLPGCDQHGWYELLPGTDQIGRAEIRAVQLPDGE